ncbi:MAG: SH3 domain-containing protein [Pararhodobacter sp.]|nr:SH3 domain-containing protein [Pararhodobacter sp.]
MIRKTLALLAATVILTMTLPVPASAGDCTGFVIGVRPVSQYNPATGAGFLAVRSGPGTQFMQIGELYLGDEIAVWERSGSWYMVRCMSGRCLRPMRGDPRPTGWVFGRYLDIGGLCP